MSVQRLPGLKVVMDSQVSIDNDEGMFVVAYIDDILIATEGCLDNHCKQGSEVCRLIMDDKMCLGIYKGVSDCTETTFLGFVVSRSVLTIDTEKVDAIVDWPQPQSRKKVQQLLGPRDFHRQFSQNFTAIVSPITDLLKQDEEFN